MDTQPTPTPTPADTGRIGTETLQDNHPSSPAGTGKRRKPGLIKASDLPPVPDWARQAPTDSQGAGLFDNASE